MTVVHTLALRLISHDLELGSLILHHYKELLMIPVSQVGPTRSSLPMSRWFLETSTYIPSSRVSTTKNFVYAF